MYMGNEYLLVLLDYLPQSKLPHLIYAKYPY